MATFTWCPALNPTRQRQPRVVSTAYGDGYVHRASIGININQDRWGLNFVGEETLIDAIDTFLSTYAIAGFWWRPPGESTDIYVVADEWSLTWMEKSSEGNLVGSLQVEFVRVYNLQPG